MTLPIHIGQETSRGVLIRIKDPQAVARSQGSAAAFASALAPAMIEGRVYDELLKETKKSFQQKGIDAEVTLVEPSAFRPVVTGESFAIDIGYAIGGAGIVGLCVWLLARKGNKR